MNVLDDDQINMPSLEQQIAAPWSSRLFAALLDILLFGMVFYGVTFLILGSYYINWLVPLICITIPLYKIVLEGMTGTTLGKKIVGLQIVLDDDKYTQINLKQSNRRFLCAWPACIFPLIVLFLDGLYVELTKVGIMSNTLIKVEWCLMAWALFDVLSYLWSNHQKSLGDHLANTRCIIAKHRPQEND